MSLECSNGSIDKSLHGSIPNPERSSIFVYPLVFILYIYRWTISPVLASVFGVGCRFEPTCSRYAEQALRKHGLWRGSILAVKRVLRCHPWHEGGFDPIP